LIAFLFSHSPTHLRTRASNVLARNETLEAGLSVPAETRAPAEGDAEETKENIGASIGSSPDGDQAHDDRGVKNPIFFTTAN
jgi:hypothetical protein